MRKILFVFFLILLSNVSFAEDVSTTEDTSPTLDPSKHELSLQAMMNNGDAVRSYVLAAFQYAYHINNTLWVGLDGFSGPTVIDSGSPLAIQNGDWLSGIGPTFYYNVPALMGATGEKARCQLYTAIGVGYLHVGSEDTMYGAIGGGMLWEASSWLGLRFDLKSIFFMLENATGSDFNMDMALSIGPSFMF